MPATRGPSMNRPRHIKGEWDTMRTCVEDVNVQFHWLDGRVEAMMDVAVDQTVTATYGAMEENAARNWALYQ